MLGHMTVLHIRCRVDSDILRIPELGELVGRDVEIVVREVKAESESQPLMPDNKYPLRGSLLWYDDPFGPAAPIEDWEASQ